MKESNSSLEDIQNKCLEDYSAEINEVAKDLVQFQKSVMGEYAEKCRINLEKGQEKREGSVSSRPSARSVRNTEVLQFDSKLVFDKSEISFIDNALEEPKQLKLLFRASDHGFKAAAFH